MIGSVVGIGLASPVALTSTEHAFFVRARLPDPAPIVFRSGEEEKPVPVRYATWLGARMPTADRLIALAEAALREATSSIGDERFALVLVTSAERRGVTNDDLALVERGLRARFAITSTHRYWGAGGTFGALQDLGSLFDGARLVALVAVDSLVAIDALIEEIENPPSIFSSRRLAAGEGAGALLLAREGRDLAAIGAIEHAILLSDHANDDNDEPIDAKALTWAVARAPVRGLVRLALGQSEVDTMRLREWEMTCARNVSRFADRAIFECLESSVGRVGAATGAMSIAYGLAAVRHRTLIADAAGRASFLAWAIGRDGTRGLAVCQAGPR